MLYTISNDWTSPNGVRYVGRYMIVDVIDDFDAPLV